MQVDVTIGGLEQALDRIVDVAGVSVQAGRAELLDVGEEVMTEAKEEHVPVRDGILRASGYVKSEEQGDTFTVIAGFGGAAAPYAVLVHENPRAGKTGGISPSGRRYAKWAQVGHYKYLEIPALAVVASLGSRISAAVRSKLG